MIEALNALEVITLFAEDLPATRAFYRDVFTTTVVFEDDVSIVLTFGPLMLNILQAAEAPELIAPLPVAPPGARALLTIRVADCDTTAAALAAHGVRLLNGPIDRPWGRRTAAFADPAGNVWEIAQELPARS